MSAVVMGMDTPWPLHDVLAKLVQATEHLLNVHACDAHGHEEFGIAAQRGKQIHALLLANRPRVAIEGDI